jgi:hypothetical protein
MGDMDLPSRTISPSFESTPGAGIWSEIKRATSYTEISET